MILKDHPEVAQLLIPTKPYSMILSVVLVTLNMTLAYLVKVIIFLSVGRFVDSAIAVGVYPGRNGQSHATRPDS